MKFLSTTCPNCGASLVLDAEKNHTFCEYCGSQLMMDDNTVHIKYDNAEQAGYEFEKGRQRAQAESMVHHISTTATADPTKKNMTWLWVLGWIFMYPIPLTILMLRNKKLKTGAKIAIIAAGWAVYLLIGILGNL